MGLEIAAVMSFLGLSGAFALIGTALAGWMSWRIVAKAGLPGWTGLGAILLTLTAVGTIVPLILLWVFAYMRWPRDEPGRAVLSRYAGPPTGAAPLGPSGGMLAGPAERRALGGPAAALSDQRGWRLSGTLPAGGSLSFAITGSSPSYQLTGAAAVQSTDLSIADPSVGQPHARLLTAAGRIGLEDLGSAGGTFIDGARLLPEHGPRDISAARSIRLGTVEMALSRA